ncbi:DUF3231 family protein [Clostridium sp.]|uniref:DUF3231 family protein n=1 Tax=Clostridium sp. TaxID=1506 RepID=UPI001A4363EB|nr:DUF3231 family protein [Clostridium sp.]MBK5242498.1 DUF3231 family protein [Clostridium sp.]
MTTEAKIQLSSSEVGTIWMAYQSTTANLMIFNIFKDKTIDKEAKNILSEYITDILNVKGNIVNIFNKANAVIPMGFDERDIIREEPPLFDDIFNIMFLRQIMKLKLGHSSVFTAISLMKEVHDLYKLEYDIADKYFVMTTNYLLGKGVLAQPPAVTIPKRIEFIENINYMSGYNILSEKRSLNTIEVGYINEAIENNILGMQLMTGFAQVAKEDEVKTYFIEGKEISKNIITELSAVLLQSDIQPPSTWAGKATDTIKTPFSDKLMMYIISLITSSALGFNALGTSFSMRGDLHVKLALIVKNTFTYSKKGGKMMIKHGWMEEPPQMEDRNQLTKIKE